MPNFSKSSKESSLVKPGNDLSLKSDRQNVIAACGWLWENCEAHCTRRTTKNTSKAGSGKGTVFFFSVKCVF